MGKGLIHRAHRRGYISGSTPKKIATCGSLILPFQGLKYINTTWSNQIRIYKFQHVTQKIDQFCKEKTCWEAQFSPEVWNSTAYSREIVKHLLKMDEILEPPILESPRSYAHAWQIYIYIKRLKFQQEKLHSSNDMNSTWCPGSWLTSVQNCDAQMVSTKMVETVWKGLKQPKLAFDTF